jgi:hypothetical protein
MQYNGNIVLLNASNEAASSLYFIHDGTGGVLGYLNLIREIKRDIKIYGVHGLGITDLAPVEAKICQIASEYTQQILDNTPDKHDLYIAGWSVGGTIACEIIRCIERAGRSVCHAFIIDSDPPGYFAEKHISELSIESELNYLNSLIMDSEIIRSLSSSASIEELWSILDTYFTHASFFNVDRFVREADCSWGCTWIEAFPNYSDFPLREFMKVTNTMRSLHYARTHFRLAGIVKTPITLLQCEESESDLMEPWKTYCINSALSTVKGEHYEIFQHDNVGSIAMEFSRQIG